MTGYDLLRESAGIIAALEAPEGADPTELDAALAAWLDSSTDKLGAYHAAITRLTDEAALLRALEARVARQRRYLERQSERVSELATALLADRETLTGESKVRRAEFSAWLADAVSVEVSAETTALPAWAVRVRVEPDRRAIADHLTRGETVEGCRLVTTRAVRWRSLRRTRDAEPEEGGAK